MADIHDEEGLEFFNRLTGELAIELTEAPVQIAPNLLNMKAPPEAQITSISLELELFEEEQGDARPLTDEELSRVVLRTKSVKLRNVDCDHFVEQPAPNGKHFTVKDLIGAIAEMEKQTRSNTEWFGGIDVHHIYFEGIELEEDGVWSVNWGS